REPPSEVTRGQPWKTYRSAPVSVKSEPARSALRRPPSRDGRWERRGGTVPTVGRAPKPGSSLLGGLLRRVPEEGGDQAHGDRQKHQDEDAAEDHRERGADDGGRTAVEHVRDARSAHHDHDEDALQAA